ncbi:MAG: DNA polymerase III subunit alpha [Ktedonobacterales bacterium]|nr:DNA polymerase III subunit alpha [Ktedonobacterales bacterium]
MAAEFTHLHVHSEYSLLDGHSRIKKLVGAAKDQGMNALALTDHGAMFGTIEFYQACNDAGIKPILGVEGYLSPRAMGERTGQYDYWHLLLLAENDVGYRNLLQLTTLAHTKGYYLRPRLDRDTLAQYSEGIIATSSCLSGEIPKLLLKEDLNGARQTAKWYQDVFGDRFFLELQEHHGDGSEQTKLNGLLLDLHRETGIPLVATNDLHYVGAHDADAQDVLLCIQTGKTLEDPKRMRFDSKEYYLKSPAEMEALFGHVPAALRNTMVIAERCNVKIPFGEASLPNFPIPPEFPSQEAYLRYQVDQGVRRIFGETTEQIEQKLDYELNIINSKGFTSYFLIVWDFVNYARSRDIRCVARGSAAGSLVSYCLGISNVDPMRYDLLFERFLNPERKSMPDIDTDFPDDRREEIIIYVAEKYGWDRVAQIVTFGTLAAKASVRDVGRTLGLQAEADKTARLIPTGPKVTLQSAMDDVKDLQTLYQQDPNVKRIYDMARSVEGSVRSTGVHAAGVVIGRDPLVQYVPMHLRDPKDPKSWLIAQYEQAHIEALGLLKMDFLGLSNLTILQNAQKFIRETRGIEIDLDRLPTEGPEAEKAFDLLGRGETTGVFQFESGAMRRYLGELKPTCVEDLTAMVALYRPGPMDSIPDFIASKHGKKVVKYLHPALERFLKESYGIIVYQDQVLLIAVHLAGFTWLEVDAFRKAMGKKKLEDMQKYKVKFITGCIKHDISESVATQLYDLIEPFSGYGFNKAHACAYAWVSYQTAYLKANYTAEFMAATLTTESSDTKKVLNAIAECKRMAVPILAPDVSHSEAGFTVERLADGTYAVRFGLLAIKNVGSRPIEEIVSERRKHGAFRNLADLCARVDAKTVTRGTVECLIKAGALDTLGTRTRLLHALDAAIKIGQQQQKSRASGQSSLFGGDDEHGVAIFDLPNIAELAQEQLLAWERELIGFYLSAHPLSHLERILKARVSTFIPLLSDEWAGQQVTLGGRVVETRRIITKKNTTMMIVQFEDLQGAIEITVFPRLYAESSEMWVEEARLFVTGKIEMREEEVRFTAERVERIDHTEEAVRAVPHHLRVFMPRNSKASHDLARAEDVLHILESYSGPDTFELLMQLGEGQDDVIVLTPPNNHVKYTPELHLKLEDKLGAGAVMVGEEQ